MYKYKCLLINILMLVKLNMRVRYEGYWRTLLEKKEDIIHLARSRASTL